MVIQLGVKCNENVIWVSVLRLTLIMYIISICIFNAFPFKNVRIAFKL